MQGTVSLTWNRITCVACQVPKGHAAFSNRQKELYRNSSGNHSIVCSTCSGAQKQELMCSICDKVPSDGQTAFVYGQLADATTGLPIANAFVDVWQASTNGEVTVSIASLVADTCLFLGLYEQQDPGQPDHNLRGKFRSNATGEFGFYCLRPTPYPVSFPPV